MADRRPLAARLRAAQAVTAARLAARRARAPWTDRPALPRPRIAPVVPAGEPWHSEACYCPVTPVHSLPCGNCERDKPVGAP